MPVVASASCARGAGIRRGLSGAFKEPQSLPQFPLPSGRIRLAGCGPLLSDLLLLDSTHAPAAASCMPAVASSISLSTNEAGACAKEAGEESRRGGGKRGRESGEEGSRFATSGLKWFELSLPPALGCGLVQNHRLHQGTIKFVVGVLELGRRGFKVHHLGKLRSNPFEVCCPCIRFNYAESATACSNRYRHQPPSAKPIWPSWPARVLPSAHQTRRPNCKPGQDIEPS